jgi:hypothetical protein
VPADDSVVVVGSLHDTIIEAVETVTTLADLESTGASFEEDELTSLPIEGYDSLAASQVVLRLGSLTDVELRTIEQYETSHRARRTVLGKISQLQAQ